MAAAVRLLDIGLFRVGGEEYAEDHETFGVASLRREHVRIRRGVMRFDYPAKASIRRTVDLADAGAGAVVAALAHRRSGSGSLFAYQDGRRWVDLHARDVNRYIKEAAGNRFSSKDFRTWSATVLTAVALATEIPSSKTGRRRAVADAVASVADLLGNTPAVCRSAYVDPRVIGHFDAGDTIPAELSGLAADGATTPRVAKRRQEKRRVIERAVIDLIDD